MLLTLTFQVLHKSRAYSELEIFYLRISPAIEELGVLKEMGGNKPGPQMTKGWWVKLQQSSWSLMWDPVG